MILVLRALGVGDLATAVPALRGLRRAFPDHPLVLAAPRWLAPLVDLIGCVDQLVPIERLAAIDWPVSPPYWAVNLHGRGPESHRLLQGAEPVLLRAFACAEAGHTDGPQWSAEEHEIQRWCRLLDHYGVPADPDDLDLHRPSPSRLPVGLTVVHPGGKEPRRHWSPARFGAVAAELTNLGHRVVVTGSPAERELAERVATWAGLPSTAVLAGQIELPDLAAMIAHARLVVSADTGVAHLATAYRTPSVVLFGPVRPDRWGPPPDRPWHRALWAGPVAGADGAAAWMAEVRDGNSPEAADAVVANLHPGLAAIDVAEVLDAADEVERAGRARGAVPA